MAAPNAITTRQLLRLIGTPQAPVLVDVRTDADFNDDPCLIPAAVRHSYDDIDGIRKLIADRPCVVICQKGKKLSQGVVSWLQTGGARAEYLEGGTLAWRATPGAPSVPVSALPAIIDGGTLWVTRHRPKIDRIACPWLIRRFVDARAQFLFVAPTEVPGVAGHFGATAFDVEGTDWSHRGDRCTFDTMLDEFNLHSEPLDRVATIVRAADTNRHDLSPEAAGLLALSVGLSRQYRDDQQQLKAGLHLYDALYRWARDGAGETHDWPAGHGQ
ncbi:sulfurtransferase [Ruegeria sp. ANG-R]|uniref:chromate resistance protein ChrB domain-containing protein n=1 Tax=Ruegeria sp. ANG-R TaxID=1577903 RepID=UPI00057DA4A8|nr:sulfurtransferase/chromate resistance protein [Ruegeria sp. ANG-R]KIC42660.1 sulfurtransferase [Ruegeria sp. ANG-R]